MILKDFREDIFMRKIKVLDIDKIFDDFLVNYIKQNRGKFDEKQWEEKVPVLYAEFGCTPLDDLDGLTPEEYYAGVDPAELAGILYKHVESGIPVSDFLCEALIKNDCTEYLAGYIGGDSKPELTSYCINILKDKGSCIAFDKYFELLLSDDTSEDMKDLVCEALLEHPEEAKDRALSAYKDAGSSRIYLLEIFSLCRHDDRIYEILLHELKEHTENIPLYLSYVVKYGDERVLPELLEIIENPAIDFAAFRELKFAIELFGGEYNGTRDFSCDRTYLKLKGQEEKHEDKDN